LGVETQSGVSVADRSKTEVNRASPPVEVGGERESMELIQGGERIFTLETKDFPWVKFPYRRVPGSKDLVQDTRVKFAKLKDQNGDLYYVASLIGREYNRKLYEVSQRMNENKDFGGFDLFYKLARQIASGNHSPLNKIGKEYADSVIYYNRDRHHRVFAIRLRAEDENGKSINKIVKVASCVPQDEWEVFVVTRNMTPREAKLAANK